MVISEVNDLEIGFWNDELSIKKAIIPQDSPNKITQIISIELSGLYEIEICLLLVLAVNDLIIIGIQKTKHPITISIIIEIKFDELLPIRES